jgi:hypothetical protein
MGSYVSISRSSSFHLIIYKNINNQTKVTQKANMQKMDK